MQGAASRDLALWAPRLRLTLPHGLDALYPLYPMSGAFPGFSSLVHSLFARTMGLGRSALVPYQGHQRRDTRLLE